MSAANKKKQTVRTRFSAVDFFRDSYNYLFNGTSIYNNIIYWGADNSLPEKIFKQATENSYFGPIINKMTDFVIGGGIKLSPQLEEHVRKNMAQDIKNDGNYLSDFDRERKQLAVNVQCDTLQDIIEPVIKDYIMFGTPAIDLYFSRFGSLSEIYYQDVIKNRLIEGRNSVRHAEKGWINGSYSGMKYDLPLFEPWRQNESRCVYMHYNKKDRTVYPLPYYYAGLKAIGVGSKITEYNEITLDEGFSPSIAITLDGTTTNEEMEHIAKETKKQFTGSKGGKILFIRKDGSGEPGAVITAIPQENIGERFINLADFNEKQIYACLDAPKQIYGNYVDAGVFNDQQYFPVLALHFDSRIYPFRDDIISIFEYIFGIPDLFEFIPSRLEEKVLSLKNTTA